MAYRTLADVLLVAHAAFVVFVVLGGALVRLRPRAAWLHLPAVLWGVGIQWSGAICPLTPLEQWLRARSGAGSYEGSFVEHYVWPLLYPDALTRSDQVVLGAIALAINAAAYGWLWRRRRPGPRLPRRTHPGSRAR